MQKAKNLKSWILGLSKKQLISGAIAILAVGGGAYAAIGGGSSVKTVVVERGSVREEVLVTGKVVAASSVKLGFERSGKVLSDRVDVGSRVVEGETLAVLDQSELTANLNKAKANLSKALIELESTKRESASSYTQAVSELVESLQESYVQADDAIRNNTDQLFTNPREYNASFDPSFSDGGYTYLSALSQETKGKLSTERVEIESILTKWEKEVAEIGTTNSELEDAYTLSRNNLRAVQIFLDDMASAINSISTTDFDYKATVSGYKSLIADARNQIISAQSALSSAKTTYNNAPYPTTTNFTYNEVLAEESRIESLREDVRAIEADLTKTILIAPISGIVTQADAKRGEMITAGQILVSILSDQELRIEANVSEVNIGRIETGNTVAINFDAFPEEDYEGTVIYVDPSEVLIDEVPTYKVTIAFSSLPPERVRSGLTANLEILTSESTDTLKVPSYVIDRENGAYYVQVKTQDGIEKRKIGIGLRGSDGSIEIVEGLSVGEEVIVP